MRATVKFSLNDIEGTSINPRFPFFHDRMAFFLSPGLIGTDRSLLSPDLIRFHRFYARPACERSPRHRQSALELDQPFHVVNEVHHADAQFCALDADGADQLAAHRAFLKAEDILDAHPNFRACPVGLFLALSGLQRLPL